jgi:Zn-dependent protease/predicted transcriptional regulator
MRWSWQIAKVAGIPVRIHATFALFIIWIFVASLTGGQDLARAAQGAGTILAIFACVVLHEYGHALTARRYGVKTRDITLLPIGGVARLERIPEKPSQEIAIAVAGPAVNVVIALALAPIVLPVVSTLSAESAPEYLLGWFPARIFFVNVMLVLFNLIPAFPMDGGRVLRAALATRLDYVRATQIAAGVGQGIALLFGLAGLLNGEPMLLFIALFVFIGATQESAAVQMRSVFTGVPVTRAMVRDFRTLRPDDPLSRAVDLLLEGHQQDFPVLGERPGDPPMGILTRSDLLTALAEGRTDRPVGDATRRNCGTAHPRDLLEDVFRGMEENGCPAVPVVADNGEIVGMVTLENVGELAMVRAALDRGRVREPGAGPR